VCNKTVIVALKWNNAEESQILNDDFSTVITSIEIPTVTVLIPVTIGNLSSQ